MTYTADFHQDQVSSAALSIFSDLIHYDDFPHFVQNKSWEIHEKQTNKQKQEKQDM